MAGKGDYIIIFLLLYCGGIGIYYCINYNEISSKKAAYKNKRIISQYNDIVDSTIKYGRNFDYIREECVKSEGKLNDCINNVKFMIKQKTGSFPEEEYGKEQSGGCSIGGKQNKTSGIGNLLVLLIPIYYIIIMKMKFWLKRW